MGGGGRIKDLKDQTYARLPARAPAHPLQLLPPFRHRLPHSTHLIRRAKEETGKEGEESWKEDRGGKKVRRRDRDGKKGGRRDRAGKKGGRSEERRKIQEKRR